MGANIAAGTALHIGTTAEVTTTDTYTEIAEVVSIPEFGRVYSVTKYNPLKSRGTQKFKGSFDDGTVAIKLGKDATDEGQVAALAALDSDFTYNFKVVANDATPELEVPTTQYFKAIVVSYTTDYGDLNQVVGSTLTLEIQSGSLTEVVRNHVAG